jgi:hypothetical protein
MCRFFIALAGISRYDVGQVRFTESSMHARRSMVFASLLSIALLVPTIAKASKNVNDYPLHVHLFQVHWNGGGYWGYRGFGRGNLIDGTETHAIEYSFECNEHPMTSDGPEDYAAKWKKQGETVELLMGEIGSQKTHTCELKVTLKPYVFERRNGIMYTVSEDDYKRQMTARAARQADLAPVDRDSAHYPLKLTILNLNWSEREGGLRSGMGQGNLQTDKGLSAVDFSIECPVNIATNPDGRYYRAQWETEGEKMNLLLHNINDPNQAAVCHLKTVMHDDVYVRQSTGVLKAVSQEAYKQMGQASAPAVTP